MAQLCGEEANATDMNPAWEGEGLQRLRKKICRRGSSGEGSRQGGHQVRAVYVCS